MRTVENTEPLITRGTTEAICAESYLFWQAGRNMIRRMIRLAGQNLGAKVPDICATARYVPPVLWATSATVSLIALTFRAFGNSMQKLSRIVMVP